MQLDFPEPGMVSASSVWDEIIVKIDPGKTMFYDFDWL